jgi:hypothetical protein
VAAAAGTHDYIHLLQDMGAGLADSGKRNNLLMQAIL